MLSKKGVVKAVSTPGLVRRARLPQQEEQVGGLENGLHGGCLVSLERANKRRARCKNYCTSTGTVELWSPPV